jgi:hypothetical protein
MDYVFDTSSFIVLGHYFPSQFPSFWERFDSAVSARRIVSVREVYRELDPKCSRQHLRDWVDAHKEIFLIPTAAEMDFIADIFSIKHFRQMVSEKQRLKGSPVADPFVIAAARVRNAYVVTEETLKDNAARIPNVCEHFSINWTNIEGFMAAEGWRF